MATINLDSQTIQNLGAEITTLDAALIQGYFPELQTELSAIASNVQGDELNSIINTINSQFSNVKSALSTELPKLENFLNDQMKNYTQTEEELDAELNAVLSKMNGLLDVTTLAMNSAIGIVSAAGTALNEVFHGQKGQGDSNNPSGNNQTSSEMAADNERITNLEKENTELKDKSNDSIFTDVTQGAVVGAGAGAVIGGIAGTIIPGAGTVAGAALGAKAGAWIGGAVPVVADVAEGAWDGLCSLGKAGANIGGALWDGAKATWKSLWD